MGLFSPGEFSKPGPGIDRDAPKEPRFVLYWKLIGRKFSSYLYVNFLLFLFAFPAILMLARYADMAFTAIYGDVITADTHKYQWIYWLGDYIVTNVPAIVQIIFLIASVVLMGPAVAGATYILRNFSREEHSWKSDFWTHGFGKGNFVKASLLGVLDFAVVFMFIFYRYFGVTSADTSGQAMPLAIGIMKYGSIVIFAFYLVMRFYMYTMLVTFDLRFIDLFKNGFLFVFLGIGKNIVVILIGTVLLFVLTFIPVLDFILILFIALAMMRYTAVYWTYPVIQKYMIDLPAKEKAAAKEIKENERRAAWEATKKARQEAKEDNPETK